MTASTSLLASHDIGLVIVGDEILSGKRADKHMPKVIEILKARGLKLAWVDYLGDDPAWIRDTFERTMAKVRARV